MLVYVESWRRSLGARRQGGRDHLHAAHNRFGKGAQKNLLALVKPVDDLTQ
jgi:hypothetical protein